LVRVATRGSTLACWQASRVADRLRSVYPGLEVELVVVETLGDRSQDVPVWEMGGQGVFVKEVQAAVLEGRADLAVHSAKDLPSATAAGLFLACVPERDDPADALVGSTLSALPAGARVATGSVRRRAQLAWLRPDLTFTGLRGNIATRLAQAGPDQVVVVAVAALHRLGLMDHATEVLDPAVMLPQVAQGALAVECRVGDEEMLRRLSAIDDAAAHRMVLAERGFLARLGGGCDLPVGALASEGPSGEITVDAMMASPDGHILLRAQRTGAPTDDPASVGDDVAEYLLHEAGGADLMGDRYGTVQ
jgi:hydroxymethylbilane synthase